MQQLRYADEVKPLSEIPIPEATVTEAELALARQFISALAKPKFEIGQYHDEYRDKLRELLDKKVKGEAVDLTPMPAPSGKVVDLMEALKASLARSAPPPGVPAQAPAPLTAVESTPTAAVEPAATERKPPRRSPRSEAAAAGAEKKQKKVKG